MEQSNYRAEIEKLQKQLTETRDKAISLQNVKDCLKAQIKEIDEELDFLLGDYRREGSVNDLDRRLSSLKEAYKRLTFHSKGIPFVPEEGCTIPKYYQSFRVYKETPKRMYYVTDIDDFGKVTEGYFEKHKAGQPYWTFRVDVEKMSELLKEIN